MPVIQGIAAVVTTATSREAACKLLEPLWSLGGKSAYNTRGNDFTHLQCFMCTCCLCRADIATTGWTHKLHHLSLLSSVAHCQHKDKDRSKRKCECLVVAHTAAAGPQAVRSHATQEGPRNVAASTSGCLGSALPCTRSAVMYALYCCCRKLSQFVTAAKLLYAVGI